jgi:hypothetical protein
MTQISVASSSSTSSEVASLDGSMEPSSLSGDVSPLMSSPEMVITTPSSTIKDLRRMELSKVLMRNEGVGISRRSRAGSWLVKERVLGGNF